MMTPTPPVTEAEIRRGAAAAVRACMNVQPADRVFIITDEETLPIGQALLAEAQTVTPNVGLVTLEEVGQRPLLAMPEPLQARLLDFHPTVTFFAAQGQPGEIAFRIALRPFLRERIPGGVRHGHMIGITPRLMREGMASDYNQVAALTRQVTDIVARARQIHTTSAYGSDVVAEFEPTYRWIPCTGLYHQPGDWGNLPEGETFTYPSQVNGVIVAHELGDHFSHKYGVLATPVTFHIANSWVTQVECDDKVLRDEVWRYLSSAENGLRAGEFAIGTNIWLQGLCGNLLQDEKLPGLHVAFGNPYPDLTGATWSAKVHVDVIPLQCTIDVDGRRLMTGGVFADDVLQAAGVSATP